jgi:hypothetical protein
VDLPTQPLVNAGATGRSARRGIALPSAMFALVAVSILAAGMFAFADLTAKATLNQERATRATQVADAGLAHAVSLLRTSPLKSLSYTRILRGSDNFIPTVDDTLLIGYGIAVNNQIPAAGKAYQGHTYFVTVRDDPADGDLNAATDLNGRVLVRCRSVTSDGATAEVSAIIGAVPMPGIAADGNLAFSGSSATISGPCGGVHANGNLSSSGGGPTIGTQATATGTVTGSYTLPGGAAAPELGGQAEVVIPDLNPMDYCAGAEYRLLSTGMVQTIATGVQVPAAAAGWTYTAGSTTWNLTGGAVNIGTYCATGNVAISGNNGTAGAPLQISILATGSISLAGNPYLRPDHDDGILLMAAGDVSVAGNPGSAYSGLVYAGAQCDASGSATLSGQMLCANGAQPAGAAALAGPGNAVSGSFTLSFDCSGNVFNKRRVLYWYPRVGT